MCFHPIYLKKYRLEVPCGRCVECQSKVRQDWSVRLQLHALQFDYPPLFVTLTYDDKHLPLDKNGVPVLVKEHVIKFIRRLRDSVKIDTSKLSYFIAGEYGDEYKRPHYHLLLFGFMPDWFEKKTRYCEMERVLSHYWSFGAIDVEWPRSNALLHYITKYCVKCVDEIPHSVGPFRLMSKGIGANYFDTPQFKRLFDNWLIFRHYSDTFEWSDYEFFTDETRDAYLRLQREIRDFEANMPELKITLPSGVKVWPPRYYRNHLPDLTFSCGRSWYVSRPLNKYFEKKRMLDWLKACLDGFHDGEYAEYRAMRENQLLQRIKKNRKYKNKL